jgi:hypothetical protein
MSQGFVLPQCSTNPHHGFCHMLSVVACLLLFCTGSQAYELLVRVKTPDHAPASGIKVQRVLLIHQEMDNALAGITDEKGELRIPFEGRQTVMDGTGWGKHRFVLMPEKYRWEVSPMYFWTCPPLTHEDAIHEQLWEFNSLKDPNNLCTGNSRYGDTVWVEPDKPLIWDVTLNPGRDVTVQVSDQHGKPVPNATLKMELDLQAPTHTGRGGEIPLPYVKTDAKGHFKLARAGDFFYSFTLEVPRYFAPDFGWLHNSVEAQFASRKGKLVFHKCALMRLSIRVTEKNTGLPIEKAELEAVDKDGCRLIPQPFGVTDADGWFKTKDFDLFDFSASISVAKTGYKYATLDLHGLDTSAVHFVTLEPCDK